MTAHSGNVTGDSGQHRKSVTFNQNARSRSGGTTGHVQSESAVNLVRNTHGQRLGGRVEALLVAAGCRLVPTAESTMCCGSAGTFSILQPRLARELRERKLAALLRDRPDVIATANVGCLEHLRTASPVPVRHWIEIVADALS